MMCGRYYCRFMRNTSFTSFGVTLPSRNNTKTVFMKNFALLFWLKLNSTHLCGVCALNNSSCWLYRTNIKACRAIVLLYLFCLSQKPKPKYMCSVSAIWRKSLFAQRARRPLAYGYVCWLRRILHNDDDYYKHIGIEVTYTCNRNERCVNCVHLHIIIAYTILLGVAILFNVYLCDYCNLCASE